jgi:iron complex transport system permease protein
MLLTVVCGDTGCFIPSEAPEIFWQLRLPRALSAFVVGALLSLAGALLQLILRNPLADPYVLGISGGAAAGAMLTSLLFPSVAISFALQCGALAGALLATILLFVLCWRSLAGLALRGASSGTQLILTGVMISAGFGALITLLLSLSSDSTLRGTLFWLMGDLDTDSMPFAAITVLALACAWSFSFATQLNVLAHGEVTAQLLGIKVQRLRIMLLVVASLATAAAVAVAGAVGFIGLVIPHVLRLWLGNDQRVLLPGAVLAGGSALVLADLVARTVVAPIQLPVGVVTALVGVPVFLYLLSRSR